YFSSKIFNRPDDSLIERALRLPAKESPGSRNVGLAYLGIIDRERAVFDPRGTSYDLNDPFGEFPDRHFDRIADVNWAMLRAHRQSEETLDQVGDITEGARLAPVAEDGKGLVAEGLGYEGRDNPTVLQAHARSVRVKDANDLCVDAVVAMVGHRHCLGEAFRLVIYATGPDRVDVAPVVLRLWMDEGIAVAFGGRGEKEFCPLILREAERIMRSERADFKCRDRVLQVVDRARRRGEMEDVIDRAGDEDELAHVAPDKAKVRI